MCKQYVGPRVHHTPRVYCTIMWVYQVLFNALADKKRYILN